jgi:hypothetical protein
LRHFVDKFRAQKGLEAIPVSFVREASVQFDELAVVLIYW